MREFGSWLVSQLKVDGVVSIERIGILVGIIGVVGGAIYGIWKYLSDHREAEKLRRLTSDEANRLRKIASFEITHELHGIRGLYFHIHNTSKTATATRIRMHLNEHKDKRPTEDIPPQGRIVRTWMLPDKDAPYVFKFEWMNEDGSEGMATHSYVHTYDPNYHRKKLKELQ